MNYSKTKQSKCNPKTALERWGTPFKHQCARQFNFPCPEPVWPPELGSRGHSYRTDAPWNALHGKGCQWWWSLDKNTFSMLSPSPMVKGSLTPTLSMPQTDHTSCKMLVLTSMASNQAIPSTQECLGYFQCHSQPGDAMADASAPHGSLHSLGLAGHSLTISYSDFCLFALLKATRDRHCSELCSVLFLPLWNHLCWDDKQEQESSRPQLEFPFLTPPGTFGSSQSFEHFGAALQAPWPILWHSHTDSHPSSPRASFLHFWLMNRAALWKPLWDWLFILQKGHYSK